MSLDTRGADAAYRGFPTFESWRSASVIDIARWNRYASLLQQRGDLSPELLRRAREVAKRAAAIDTGAIEGLYEVDRGFTFTVALQLANWEAQLDAKGAHTRAIIEAQMSAYDYVLDFATQRTPIVEAWIRTLHEVICQGQETYTVYTEVGVQQQALQLGRYKALPNHVLKPDGAVHSYAPVELVPAEMHRLVEELAAEGFLSAHPAVQAAYAHYAFVLIHPFSDGNGRVARALASVYTYRGVSVPLVILAEHRVEYFDTLAAADAGQPQPFVDFITARTLDSIQIVNETLRAAGHPAPAEAAAALRGVYVTRGGLTHDEVDKAGYALVDALVSEILRQGNALKSKELNIVVEAQRSSVNVTDSSYRAPVTQGPRVVQAVLDAIGPAQARVVRRLTLEVPRDSGEDDDLVLRDTASGETFTGGVKEAHPQLSATLRLRLAIFVHAFLGKAITDLAGSARGDLREKGY
jgi:Uncharacterized conserved protein